MVDKVKKKQVTKKYIQIDYNFLQTIFMTYLYAYVCLCMCWFIWKNSIQNIFKSSQ